MDYKKLADLLFPDVKHTVDYYFSMYPKRKLTNNAEVTRIAPSPTGYLHVGGLFQGVIDYMLAHASSGIFYMRLEDTDAKREVADAGTIAYNSLCLFGLKPMEGYRGDTLPELGDYGPYVQSNRVEIYHTFAKKLVELGRAFPCFCEKAENKEDILKRRNVDIDENDTIRVSDECRNLSYEEIEENIKNHKPWALRLLSLGDGEKTIQVNDRIKGKRELRANAKDIVLLKSNGVPPYAFAHLVDDTLMGTTTVVRGEEWYQSLPSHIELFEAFGLTAPNYAHTPVICKLDNGAKRKLSKRKDPEADTRYYLKRGYLKQAVVEYLINLSNSDFEDWRTKNPDTSYLDFDFKIEKIGSNNPIFDFNKLNDMSKNIIARMSAKQVYEELLNWAKEYDVEFFDYISTNSQYVINVLNIDRGGVKPRKDIACFDEIKYYFSYMWSDNYNVDYSFVPKVNEELIYNIVNKYAQEFDANVEKNVWFDNIKVLAEQFGFAINNKEYKEKPDKYNGNVSDFCTILRMAFTGRVNSPDLFSICVVLGKDKLIERAKNS